MSGARLFLELRERGYSGGISMVRRYVAKVRAPRAKPICASDRARRQAQSGLGAPSARSASGATQRPLSAFAMVLSWSRMLFIDFAFEQQADTFLRMHQRAFSTALAACRKLLYDNLKTVVLHHVGNTVQFNPAFLAFAEHYLFEPVAAPVRYPQAKGRVRRAIRLHPPRLLRHGRQFRDIDRPARAGRALVP